MLAMPMSPVTRHRLPAATRSRATSAPVTSGQRRPARGSSRGRGEVGGAPADLAGKQARAGSRSAATPTSTTVTSAPACAANALTTAPPARKLATIWAVTSCGHGVTPWACTPWSAANTATQAGSGSGGGQLPGQPGQPDRHLLEHAERAARLGHPVLPLPRGGHRLGVRRRDRGEHLGERVHWFLPGSPRRPNSSACTAHDTGRRRAQPAVGQLRFGPELAHVTHAQVRDRPPGARAARARRPDRARRRS